jgi:hypothetical protein
VKFLSVLGWLGVGFIALGLPLSFSSSSTWTSTGNLGSGVGYMLAWILGMLGALLILIGGFIARPPYLRLGAILIGLVYISSFYGWMKEDTENLGWLFNILPGLVCIIDSIIIKLLSNRKKV